MDYAIGRKGRTVPVTVAILRTLFVGIVVVVVFAVVVIVIFVDVDGVVLSDVLQG